MKESLNDMKIQEMFIGYEYEPHMRPMKLRHGYLPTESEQLDILPKIKKGHKKTFSVSI